MGTFTNKIDEAVTALGGTVVAVYMPPDAGTAIVLWQRRYPVWEDRPMVTHRAYDTGPATLRGGEYDHTVETGPASFLSRSGLGGGA